MSRTYKQTAESYALWCEYVDPAGTMNEAEFNALTTEDKIRIQVEAFGPESNENNLIELTKHDVLNVIIDIKRSNYDSDADFENAIHDAIEKHIERPACEALQIDSRKYDIYSVFANVDLLRDTVRDYIESEVK